MLLANFKKGDLLYGLQSERAGRVVALRKKVGNDTAVIVDEYNNLIISQLSNLRDQIDLNGEQAKNYLKWQENPTDTSLSSEALSKHFNAIVNPSYSNVSLSNNLFPKNPKKLDEDQRRVRRACKARLLDPSITIHFLLDSLDVAHTFDREYSLAHRHEIAFKEVKCVYDTHTAAELRFVLKHHHEIHQHIKFYIKDQEVDVFEWLAQRSPQAKVAVLQWAAKKSEEKKLHEETYKKIQTAIGSIVESKEEAGNVTSSPVGLPKLPEAQHYNNAPLFFMPPPTPRKTAPQVSSFSKSREREQNNASSHSMSVNENLFRSFPSLTSNPVLPVVPRTPEKRKHGIQFISQVVAEGEPNKLLITPEVVMEALPNKLVP